MYNTRYTIVIIHCITLWYAALYGDGSIQWLYLCIISGISCVIIISYPRRNHTKTRRLFDWYYMLYITVEDNIPIVRRLRKINQSMLDSIAERAGMAYDTEQGAITYTRRCITCILPCAICSTLGIMFLDVIWGVLCILPCIIYFAPVISLRLRIRSRHESVSDESAFFLSYVNIMQSVGVGLYRSFEIIHKGGAAFPAMKQDASTICKRVMTGSTRNEALLHYAKHHPVRIIRDFVSGYITKQSAMGDVPGYTTQKAYQAFSEYESSWTRYEKSVQEIFGGIMMFAIVLPLMIMLSAMLGTPETVRTLLMAGTAISPLISLTMILLLNQSQPYTGGKAEISPFSGVIGIICGIVCIIVDIQYSIAVSVGVMAFAFSNHMIRREDIRKSQESERMLPEFLRDMTEMSRTGQSVSHIIIRQARQRIYGRHFDGILEKIAAKVSAGYNLEEALRAIHLPGKNTRFAMFLLGVAHRTGGDTITILEMVTEFAAKIQQIKDSVTKSLAPLCYIVYATPFITLGLAHLMLGIFAGSASDHISDDPVPFSPISGDTLQEYTDGMSLMAVAMSIPMGIVASKITSYTIRYTIPLGIVACCNVAAVYIIPYMMELVGLV